MKKIIFLGLIILLIATGGFFWWQQGQKDVKELNKKLPEGIKVAKSFLGEYKVINKIDGYEFKVPKAWNGINIVEYTSEGEEKGRIASSIYVEGLKESGNIISIDMYKVNQTDLNLDHWARDMLIDFGLGGEFKQEKFADYSIITVIEEEHLGGAYISFLNRNSKVYVFTARSNEIVRNVIINGKW